MKLVTTLLLLFSTLLYSDIYDEYQLSKSTNLTYKQDYFFDGEFDEIIRFVPVVFNENGLGSDGNKTLQDIRQKIDSYKDGKRNFFISIIGHTRATTDDENENKIDSKTYANKIQNIFRDSFDTNESSERSKNNAQIVKQYFLDNGINEKIIEIEYRKGLDNSFSDETDKGKSLSNRVMVSLYVEENLDLDDDSVVNSRDFCPNTKLGIVVDKDGCKFKTLILLAENKKSHNAIEVSTIDGSRVIDSPRDYTFIKSKYDTPRLYKSMSDEKMNDIFSDVLDSSELKKFTIYFNNTDFVDEELQFSQIIDFLSTKKDTFIQIIGHTDSKGTNSYNDELAKKRAEIVLQKIKASGVEYLYLSVESYGEYNLAVKTADGVREAKNRRVEVLIR